MTKCPIPIAAEAERATLCSVLMDPSCLPDVIKLVSDRDFFDEANRAVLRSIMRLHGAGQSVDAVTVSHDLDGQPEFKRVRPVEHLAALAQVATTSAHAGHYAEIVREVSRKRQLWEFSSRAVDAATNGRPSGDILTDLGGDIFEMQREQAGDGEGLASMAMPEFIEQDFSVDCLIDGVIVAKQPGILAAKSKTQKTTILLDACLSMASGTPFMGKWNVPAPIPVGILSGESGGATISETLRRIARSKGIDPMECSNLLVSTQIPALCEQKGQDLVERFIEDNGLRFLGIDPTYLATAGIEDSSISSMATVLGPLSAIIERTGCSIMPAHHNRKTSPKPYGEPTLEEITGAGWAQWARYWILLNKRREWEPDVGQHWLWMCTGSSSGFGSRHYLNVYEGRHTDPEGRTWSTEFSTPSEGAEHEREQQEANRAAQQMMGDRNKVCDVLVKHPEGLTKTKMMTLAGFNRNRWDTVLETMLDEGDIVPFEVFVGNQKTPLPGFRLAKNDIP